MKNNLVNIQSIIIVLSVFIFWFYFGLDYWGHNIWVDRIASDSSGIVQNLDDNKLSFVKFWKVYSIIEQKWIDWDKLNDKKHLEDAVIAGLVRSLDDPYSLYMTEQENEEFKEDLAGNFEWIGAELSMKDELVTVVSPLKDSPAMNAGIMPQDVIVKVDDKEILGWALTDVIKKIRGPKWEEVKLTISREKEPELKEIKIIRDTIHIESVKYEFRDNYAIISVNQFGDNTVSEFFDALKKAEKDNPKWVIMDLRYNWWWYLDASVVLASPFLDKWDIVTTMKSKDADQDPKDLQKDAYKDIKTALMKRLSEDIKYAINIESSLKGKPMVVLINLWSASASEIVAGALRDNERAILLGTKSFWKWTVQELVNLSWKSSLRITTAKWYTPNGINIHKVGITPDIIVPRTYDELIAKKDPQLDMAIKVLSEWDFDKFFKEKLSLTGSAVIEYNWNWTVVSK